MRIADRLSDVVSARISCRDPRKRRTPPIAKAEEVVRFFNFSITNSMVVTWIVALGLIAFAHVATRNMKPVPKGTLGFIANLVEPSRKATIDDCGELACQSLGICTPQGSIQVERRKPRISFPCGAEQTQHCPSRVCHDL
jgi:hypothetical protein